jgi:hypothetical protein
MLYKICTTLAFLPVLALAAKVSTVYQFPSGTWAENIAVRSNGNLLVVLYSQPEIYEINPFVSPATAHLVARFNNSSGIQGIAEVAEDSDVFAVMPFKGSEYSVWTVNLKAPSSGEDELGKRQIIERVEGAGALNGLTRLNDGILLASDTMRGNIVRLDIAARSASTAIEDETMIGLPFIGAGINGVRVHDSSVWYTNFYRGILCRVPLDPISAAITGPVQIIAKDLKILDDLAVSEDGTAYVMQYLDGSVARVHLNGSSEVVAIGLDRPTSAQFGRTAGDKNVLYVSSSGNPLGPTLRGVFDGGRVYAIDLGR